MIEECYSYDFFRITLPLALSYLFSYQLTIHAVLLDLKIRLRESGRFHSILDP